MRKLGWITGEQYPASHETRAGARTAGRASEVRVHASTRAQRRCWTITAAPPGEILALAREVQVKVHGERGIALEPEPVIA